MPIERIAGTDLSYSLISYDADGRERRDDPDGVDGLLSRRVIEELTGQAATDVFLFSHGWKGDVPSAREDYANWLKAAAQCTADIERLRSRPQGFKRVLVGLHWPSQPWGDETFAAPAASFAVPEVPAIEGLVEAYARRLADTPAARQALMTIFAAAQQPPPPQLPDDVRSAYSTLNREAALGSGGVGAPPGADREPFDPQRSYENARAAAIPGAPVSFGLREDLGNFVLSPLRQLSFWKMKDRARAFGESGAHTLVSGILRMQQDFRVHLMGHSFGCIVMSAAIAGPPGGPGLPRPVQSLVLVQGALSLWSYCSDIPFRRGQPGYFLPIVTSKRVAGPIVTTQSRFDTAVGRWYPLGAGVARQISFAPDGELPQYGGVGTFGLRGPGLDLVDLDMQAADQPYGFEAGRVYNLESSQFIRVGGGASGAHSDIAHPEVAHALWEATLVSDR